MVRVKLPCFSAEAHGSIIPGVVFATNQWGQYVKFFAPKPRDPTPAQITVRHTYGEIAGAWRVMTPNQKQAYHQKAVRNRRTNFNQFFSEKWPEYYNP